MMQLFVLKSVSKRLKQEQILPVNVLNDAPWLLSFPQLRPV